MLNKQMPEYIRHHRMAHHQLQVFREHREAVQAGQDGKVVISCDWSEKLTVERSVEIMSEHWHAQQIGILVACAYFKNRGPTMSRPYSVKQLCTLGKKLSVKMLNEYCKAVGLYVPANTLRADLRYMVLEHLNEQAEWD
ncbi:hypothetical protein QJQ45_014342 [Haematococcus lacustris]|nr:hypothetical protein QJQ45_014342 [Haematococcus lacustris]